ncbi:MAG TPA: glutamine ABC transporter ATP-binding protein [Opitutae bacterium]|nr:glutamine ABC transporter ATP-binding protein [Opitutaceae bacterium]HCR30131.1 glutamine ABC transporter ATP-binding protein [Opitutae bacterium]
MKLLLRDVVKRYGGLHALDGLTLEIEDTNCLALIGPSGGGKSTTLRLVSGLEAPTSGCLLVDGEEIGNDFERRRQFRKQVGIVFQAYNLFPHMTALANVALPLEKVHGYPKADAIQKARSLFERFQLEDHMLKKPAELSGGQNQRVAIARAMAPDPDIIFLDEPTSALDPEMTVEVLDAIYSLIETDKRIVIATHQMGFAQRAADTVALIAEGKLVEAGSSNQVIENPQTIRGQKFLAACLDR